jgi:outer membrane biogenesis lipoprotein LolB
MTDRQKLLAAILASVPALLMACTAWVQADAARKREAKVYEQAGDALGEQSDEMIELRARIAYLEVKCKERR